MALLSGMMRTAAITGSTEPIDAWFAGRQWGWWAAQWARPGAAAGSAAPQHAPAPAEVRPPADAAATLRSLTRLHEHGIIDDRELERLRLRLGM